ncbi:hypothetical protein L211DRAFT_355268 [Terfezia boudieri ATCC MYA-4762]|uniref:Uncharacterized protein n=1 Tax=Terfezia boudieri ATCC MYA-4762 TaxID=1051890 RepID=A0A3N4LKS7_9PEZI|nr:hypothetical protein L211DRAFT_355268 [Terfezia boudieri ATCC MYA-4762]
MCIINHQQKKIKLHHSNPTLTQRQKKKGGEKQLCTIQTKIHNLHPPPPPPPSLSPPSP